MRLLLDTSVLLDALRPRPGRRAWLAEMVRRGYSLETSAVNVAEVYSGMHAAEERETKEFLEALLCHPLNCRTAQSAGRLRSQWSRKGKTLSVADAMVAAVAIEQGCVLATDNRKNFPMPEVQLYKLPE